MADSLNMKFMDHSDENSGVRILADTIDDGADYTAILGARTAMLAAVQALSLGAIQRSYFTVGNVEVNAARPTNPYAQRELKWLVSFRNPATGWSPRLTIPMANLIGGSGNLVQAGNDFADLTQPEWVTFIAQINGGLWGGGAVDGNYVFEGAELVGRNL